MFKVSNDDLFQISMIVDMEFGEIVDGVWDQDCGSTRE